MCFVFARAAEYFEDQNVMPEIRVEECPHLKCIMYIAKVDSMKLGPIAMALEDAYKLYEKFEKTMAEYH